MSIVPKPGESPTALTIAETGIFYRPSEQAIEQEPEVASLELIGQLPDSTRLQVSSAIQMATTVLPDYYDIATYEGEPSDSENFQRNWEAVAHFFACTATNLNPATWDSKLPKTAQEYKRIFLEAITGLSRQQIKRHATGMLGSA